MTGRYRGADMKSPRTPQTDDEARSRSGLGTLVGSRTARLAALALLVVGLLVAVAFTVFYSVRAYQVYGVEVPRQELRDDARETAEQAILNVLTIDPTDTVGWRERVDSSLTGEAREQVSTQLIDDLAGRVGEAGGPVGAISTRIERSVPTRVDVDDDTAEIMVFAIGTATVEGQEPTSQNWSFLTTVVSVDGDRKVSRIVNLDSLAFDEVPDAAGAPGAEAPDEEGGN